MITIKEIRTLSNIYDLRDMSWSGATARIDEAIDKGIGNEFFDYVVSMFDWSDEEIDATQLNDFVWFECDEWLEENGCFQ